MKKKGKRSQPIKKKTRWKPSSFSRKRGKSAFYDPTVEQWSDNVGERVISDTFKR